MEHPRMTDPSMAERAVKVWRAMAIFHRYKDALMLRNVLPDEMRVTPEDATGFRGALENHPMATVRDLDHFIVRRSKPTETSSSEVKRSGRTYWGFTLIEPPVVQEYHRAVCGIYMVRKDGTSEPFHPMECFGPQPEGMRYDCSLGCYRREM